MSKKVYVVKVPFEDEELAVAFGIILQCVEKDDNPSDLRAILGYMALNSVLKYAVKKEEDD